jgi:probable F420-dependent oxidoreductase
MDVLRSRDHERLAIGRLLESARAGRGGGLVLRGEPGIGKSTLLAEAREGASGMRILSVTGVEAESSLAFAALHQLLHPIRKRPGALFWRSGRWGQPSRVQNHETSFRTGESLMTTRTFRFGVVAAQEQSGGTWLDKARRIESLGFATLVMPDTLQYTLSPFPALAAAAAVTRSLRIGTYVVANDYRHPVMLAKEAATLDFISGGRFELGIGAGRPVAGSDYAMLGLPFDAGSVRVDRLKEALQIVKPLLGGQSVDFAGAYYTTTKATVSPAPVQLPPPILIAASQPRLLRLAAREADIIALAIQPQDTEAAAAERIGWIRDAAGERFADIAININLMGVAGQVPRQVEMSIGAEATRQLAESDAIPVLKGTTEQMCDRLEWLRERFGISYILVGDQLMDALAPVVSRLAGK